MATNADWRDTKTAPECLAHLCLTEKMSDVIFGFPDSTLKLHAHKFVLSMRSVVFETMFYGPLAERRKEIPIEDSDPETFTLFLRYVYSDKTALEESTLLDCLNLGRKYYVQGFAQACLTFLETSVSAESICARYEQACQVDMPDLHAKCLGLMAIHAEPIFQSEKFFDISNKTLVAFLNCDDLNTAEMSVFNSTVKWAKHQCAKYGEESSLENVRKYIGDALYSIRLPTLPIKIFAEVIVPSQLLSHEEEVQIYKYIETTSDVRYDCTGGVGRFNANTRKPNIVEVLFPDEPCRSMSYSSKQSCRVEICISTSSRLKLLSVSASHFSHGIKSVFYGSSELEGNEWLIIDDKLLLTKDILLNNDNNTIVVNIKKSVWPCNKNQQEIKIVRPNIRISYATFFKEKFKAITFGK